MQFITFLRATEQAITKFFRAFLTSENRLRFGSLVVLDVVSGYVLLFLLEIK